MIFRLIQIAILLIFNLVIYSFGHYLCEKNYFKIQGMTHCHPFLTCSDISNITIKKTIGYGAVKHVFLAKWGKWDVAYSVLKNPDYIDDFKQGLQLMKMLNPSIYIVQLLGYCEAENIILTEYQKFNNANNIIYLLEMYEDQLMIGIKLCLNYVEILNYLHNSPAGIRVNCDTNGLAKLLSQFLIKSDLTLILNDLDAIPEITNSSVVCGQGLISDLSISEEMQHQKHGMKTLSYTEKSDIWKIPDVCNSFLPGIDYTVLQYFLYNVHRKCKENDPAKRPTASFVVEQYKSLLSFLQN